MTKLIARDGDRGESAPAEDILELTELAPPEAARTSWTERLVAMAVGTVNGAALALAPDLIEDDTCYHCQWASAAAVSDLASRPIADADAAPSPDFRDAALGALIVRARTAISSGDLDGARWYLDSAERLGADPAGLGDLRRLVDLLATLPRDS
jgi:hypothetical protein